MNDYKVYQYIFPDGMIYIGMTSKSLQWRRDCGYGHNPRLREHVKKYGWKSVKTIILADDLTKGEACAKEIEYISKLDANNPEKGFNVSKGGIATYEGLKHTEEYKQKMSDMNKGKTFSPATMERLKVAHKGERKPVIQYGLAGDEIARFESLGEAAKAVNGYKSNISRACANNRPYKDCLWAFRKEVV